MNIVKAHHRDMTTTTCIQEIEDQPSLNEDTPARSGRSMTSRFDRALRCLRAFWRDQLYLHERLLAAQRPWDDASDPR
jgi:hypothetical protein